MMTPRRRARTPAGVSPGATSAYPPKSRTLRAMRWQYCPPASRTVIWGSKPITLLLLILAGDALYQQRLRVIEQRPRLGHRLDALKNGGILLDSYALRFLETERRDVHLALQAFLDRSEEHTAELQSPY